MWNGASRAWYGATVGGRTCERVMPPLEQMSCPWSVAVTGVCSPKYVLPGASVWTVESWSMICHVPSNASAVISSLPLRATVGMAGAAASPELHAAAKGLRYRDFLTVALVIDGEDLFPDNWIYIHEPSVRVGRVQNYRSWSPWMVPDADKACVGLEYFCFQGDDLWTMSDEGLVELAKRELEELGLTQADKVDRGYVTRVPLAYPMYDSAYADRVSVIRGWLEGIGNLQQVGRNGLHRYNNSDHSMLTGIRAVENLFGASHDLWSVNADSWYHETQVVEEQPYRGTVESPQLARLPGA